MESDFGGFNKATKGMPLTSKAKGIFDPLQMIVLRKAVRKKETSFKLGEREFTIDYDKSEDRDIIYIKPVKGFTPCGYWSIKKIMEVEQTT